MPGDTVNDMPVLVTAIATSTHDGRWSLNDPQGVLKALNVSQICNLTLAEFKSSEIMEAGGKLSDFTLIKAHW
jgi:hypothetical protein